VRACERRDETRKSRKLANRFTLETVPRARSDDMVHATRRDGGDETTPLVKRQQNLSKYPNAKRSVALVVALCLAAVAGVAWMALEPRYEIDMGELGTRRMTLAAYERYAERKMAEDWVACENITAAENAARANAAFEVEPNASSEDDAESHRLSLLIARDTEMMRMHRQQGGLFEADVSSEIATLGQNGVNGAVNTVSGEGFCWLDSYGRGVGTIPYSCPSDKERIAGGLYCYDKCSKFSGSWKRFGYDCHQNCKSGWADHGLLCYKGFSYGRGVGTVMKMTYKDRCVPVPSGTECVKRIKVFGKRRCVLSKPKFTNKCTKMPNGLKCPSGKEQDAALCYTPCRSGYTGRGPVCWGKPPNCKGEGYAGGVAPSCMKGIKISPGMKKASCPSDKENDAGLCYPRCRDGYRGVGPVCWGKPPDKWTGCGMGAASSSYMCSTAVIDQVVGPLEVAAFVLTMGSSGAASKAADAAGAADEMSMLKKLGAKLDDTISTLMKNAGDAKSIKSAAKSLLDSLTNFCKKEPMDCADSGGTIVDSITTMVNCEAEIDCIRGAAAFVSLFDPSGLASTLAAYAWPKCSDL
jgi:hypothetical protein